MATRYWIFIAAVLGCSGLVFGGLEIYDKYFSALPFYGPVADEKSPVEYHRVPEFQMTNQDGRKVMSAEFEDKVIVANFFFTSCPTICPQMMRNMQNVQELYLNDPEIAILSFTVDPRRDTPARLASFAESYHIDSRIWHLLTGEKSDIYNLARNGFYLTASQGDGGDHDFIHSENIVLLDREKRIRGYYDGTDREAVDNLLLDIVKLKRGRT